jgi:hypothetical protein
MAAAKLTAQQQRDRRAKIMLGVLGVLLVGVLALQLPKMLHSGGSTPAAPPSVATTAAGAALVSAPAPAQLQHFSRFAPKDPFRSQVAATNSATSTSTSPAVAAAPKAKPKPQPPLTISVTRQPAPVVPRVPAALLRVDGKRHVVPLNGLFPAKHPVFRVVALSEKALWIQLIGGSLANGQRTVRLDLGRRVTLENTTAGPKIALVLVKPTTAPKLTVAGATSGAPAG